jgi:nicotinic acid phosphoribosyltransferase
MTYIKDERNLTMLTDFYELTMANGYLLKGMKDTQVVFDMFFRKIARRKRLCGIRRAGAVDRVY